MRHSSDLKSREILHKSGLHISPIQCRRLHMATQVRRHWGIQLSPHRKVTGLGPQEEVLSSLCVDFTMGYQLHSGALLLSPRTPPCKAYCNMHQHRHWHTYNKQILYIWISRACSTFKKAASPYTHLCLQGITIRKLTASVKPELWFWRLWGSHRFVKEEGWRWEKKEICI